MSLDLDFAGRMKKIRAPAARSLQAVFEAVANSFDATEDLGTEGQITIRIRREEEKGLFNEAEKTYRLTGIEIHDNGVGFNDQNMQSFRKSDTTHKVDGKGVGRLLWLKVFDNARVTSVYKEGAFWRQRDFQFSVQKGGVDDKDIVPQDLEAGECKTTICLLQPKADRVGYLPQDPKVLAARMLEHFLLYFAVLKGPRVTVEADFNPDPVDVGELYKDIFGERHKTESLTVGEYSFQLHHLFVKPTTTRRNLVRICARRRVVTSESVTVLVPDVSSNNAVTADNNYRYHAYVTGHYFDENADDERSDIRFARSDSDKEDTSAAEDSSPLLIPDDEVSSVGGLTKDALYSELAKRIGEHLKDYVADVRKKKERRLEEYAQKDKPQFRPFVEAAKQHLDRLPARPTGRDIELALYEAKIDGREELDKSVDAIIKTRDALNQVDQTRSQLVDRFATEANRQALSSLAEYVCTRKAVINVLKASLKKTDGDYEHEALIHDLFFPRHLTSNDIPVGALEPDDREIENLWLIDERLVFHRLLASDKPLSTLKRFVVADASIIADVSRKNDEPDILVFDPAFVTAESNRFESLAIVEFKRPGRDDYTLSKNPIQQVVEIARKIRDAKQIEAVTGEIIPIPFPARMYAYVVCDVVGTLRPIIEDSFSMKRTPDGIGYYVFNDNLNMLIEVIPYSKIVMDAERRNAAFFAKLGMS